nr:iron chelate uptake ABC transporter family permease subunit [Nakamurella flavida]
MQPRPVSTADRPLLPAVRVGGWSMRVRRRAVLSCVGLAVACLAVVLLATVLGDYPLPVRDVVASLTGRGTTATDFVVLDLRLARVLCAIAVGMALGAAGAVFQSLTRNPLGSPDIIGFTQGAATGALLQILVLGGSAAAIASGAVVGGLLTSLAVYLLAVRGGSLGYRLILVGIGLNFMLGAVNWYLLISADLQDAITARVWIIGSLNSRGWEQLWPLALTLAVGLPVLMALSRPLGQLELGDDLGRQLGVRVGAVRIWALVVSVVVTAAAVATAGPIAFVALAAPQLARRLTGSPTVGILPAALMGGFVLASSDLVAQRLFAPTQFPVGIATGAVGGVYLAALLLSEWKKGRG